MTNILSIEKLVVVKKSQKADSPTQEVALIKGITTFFESGKLNAIMGPNGSSKTTLLQFLYGNCESTTKCSGKILYNGVQRDINEWRSIASIVEQHEQVTNFKTVRGHIQFYLDLKNSTAAKKQSLSDFSEVLEKLYLIKLLDSKIASLSGGEKHRLLIATEIIVQRPILILDEPTSDLDSHLALELIRYLKRLAVENNIMMIFSIHQPADMIVKQFDNLLFMNEGSIIYSGPFENLSNFLAYYNIPKPDDWAISDFLFEAFYNNSSYKAISEMKPRINLLFAEINKNTSEVLGTVNPICKTSRVPNWKFNFGEIFVLFKRLSKQCFFARSYLYVILPYFAYLLLNTLLTLSESGYNDYYSTRKSLNAWNSTPYAFVDKFPEFFKVVRQFSLETSVIFSVACFSLFTHLLKSGAFDLLPFIENDFKRNCFSSLSFVIAAFLVELCSFSFTAVLTTTAIRILLKDYEITTVSFARILLCHFLTFPAIYTVNALFSTFSLRIQIKEVLKLILVLEPAPMLLGVLSWSLLLLGSYSKILKCILQVFFGIYYLIFPSFFLEAIMREILSKKNGEILQNEFNLLTVNDSNEKTGLLNIIDAFKTNGLVLKGIVSQIYTEYLPSELLLIISLTIFPLIATLMFTRKFTPKTCLNP